MKKSVLIATFLLLVPFLLALPAAAGHLDVIQVKLREGCSLAQYLSIVKDFNAQWGQKNGYTAELAVPIQNDDLVHVFWLGRTADTAAFGRAWDVWRSEITDSASVAGKLNARFTGCSENVSRNGWDLY
jgi:hypothetical protein